MAAEPLWWGMPWRVTSIVLMAVPATIVFGLLVWQRLVISNPDGEARTLTLPVRVSIRQWFFATAAFGILLTNRKFVGVNYYYIDTVAFVAPCLAVVQLAAIWASLAARRPLLPLFVLVAGSLGLGFIGAIPDWIVERRFLETAWRKVLYWPSVFGIVALITAGSLLVIRTCGYRLVRGTAVGATPSPTEAGIG
jgi:hypothetical protein